MTEHVRVGLTADYAEVQLVAARAMGLVARRPNGPYDIWLTNDVQHAVKHIKDNKPAKVTLHVRKDTDPSVKVELGQKITW